MSGLRFAVLLAASFFGVLLLAASATSSASRPPAVFFVGDEWRQATPASNDYGTQTALGKWAMRQRFYVGDVLDFKNSNDSVLLMRQGDYKRCSVASPARRFADGGGDTRFTLVHAGLFYFISGAPARCEAGQRMVVRVVDARSSLGEGATTPAAAPAPGAMEPSNRDTPLDDRPMPLWFTLLVPTVVGFMGGCFTGGLLIMYPCRMNMLRLAGRA